MLAILERGELQGRAAGFHRERAGVSGREIDRPEEPALRRQCIVFAGKERTLAPRSKFDGKTIQRAREPEPERFQVSFLARPRRVERTPALRGRQFGPGGAFGRGEKMAHQIVAFDVALALYVDADALPRREPEDHPVSG